MTFAMSKPEIQERPEDLLGKIIAERYELLEIIGQGGIGVVYKARHTLMNRIVAFKMLRSESLKDERNRKRFQQEAEAMSKLSHPNIVSVFDFGFTQDDSAFLVMDFLDGKDLDTLIQEEGYLTPEEVAPIFIQICDAMTLSHTQGIIHRDLKPGNIIVVREGKESVAKLVDFGMAKFETQKDRKAQSLTRPGEVFGSPYYMSPEQCIGAELDARSDIYSMGVLMYEAVTGQPTFLANNMVEMAQMHIYEKPKEISKVIQDPDFPEGMQKIIFKALEKNVNDRYQCTEELKQALMAFSKFWRDKTGGGESKSVSVRQATTTKNLKAEIEAAKAFLAAQGISISPAGGVDLPKGSDAGAANTAKSGADRVPPPPPAAVSLDEDTARDSGTIKVTVSRNVVIIVAGLIAILLLVGLWFYLAKPAQQSGREQGASQPAPAAAADRGGSK
jgi:eukaryotic-like serine/threonine-protein kinase